MSDEIDIEEHDVMNNPIIRRIFPDISIIKKEISKYEDGLEIKPEPLPEVSSPTLDSLPDAIIVKNDIITYSDHLNISDQKEKIPSYLPNNVIILGSKPNKLFSEELDLQSVIESRAQVKLQNIHPYLQRSKTYCKECMILFPKVSSLEIHIKSVHDHNPKTSTDITKKGNESTETKYKCNICSNVLSTKANLLRHLKNIHDISHKNNEKDKMNAKSESKAESLQHRNCHIVANTGAFCFHCKVVFPTQKALVDHLYDILEPKKMKSAMIFSNQENLQKHENSVHISEFFECHKCAIKFVSKEKLEQHNQHNHSNDSALAHSITNNKNIVEKLVEDESVTSKRLRKTFVQNEKSQVQDTVNNLRHKNELNNVTLSKVKCLTCNKSFHNEKMLRQHNTSFHSNKLKLIKESEQTINTSKKQVAVNDKKILSETAYRCNICSYYVFSLKHLITHMKINHNVKAVNTAKKVSFDSQCNFCTMKFVDIRLYNSHLLKYHKEKTKLDGIGQGDRGSLEPQQKRMVKERNRTAFKSVLYKCIKCDVHFPTAKTAINHRDHIELLINWKCQICSRIFKRKDKFLHQIQHSKSHSFNVYDVSESSLGKILYMCLKCTVYFSEDSYICHYSTCDDQTPDSVYCKVCDSLINKKDFDSHDQIHAKNVHLGPSDFTIVEADLIESDIKATNDLLHMEDVNVKKDTSSKKFNVIFCDVCKSFSINMRYLVTARHMEGRCANKKKYVCQKCGLIFTTHSFNSHKKQHQDVKGLSINNYMFFDLKSRKPISPPLPTYPSCNICEVHFLSRNDVREHVCTGCNYMRCNICQIKLSEVAFKFHMQYHEYSMDIGKELSTVNDVAPEDSSVPNDVIESEFLYNCVICNITFHLYDFVVEHCQFHYSHCGPVITQICTYCAFNFDKKHYKMHERVHLQATYNVQSLEMINFDPFYFRFDNNFWIKHIFRSLTQNQLEKILCNSIYQFEGRLKMEVFQSGATNNTFYQCERCLGFIVPENLYLHSENTQCTKMEKYPCMICGLHFDSATYKTFHEQMHSNADLSLKSYRLVKTNKEIDQVYHESMFKSRGHYILYQCRNCQVAIDKIQRNVHQCVTQNVVKCLYCGLLFGKQDYDTHFNRHEKIDKFDINHIHVVLFGKKLYKGKQVIVSAFSGKIYDYTFYKCATCELCVQSKESTLKHKCVFDESKCKCLKCDLYFLRQELISHATLHRDDVDFEDNDLNIIIFLAPRDLTDSKGNVNKATSLIQSSTNMENKNTPVIGKYTETSVKLFKCDCGLHFIDETNARKHYSQCNPNIKISKQHCSKCELLFTPGELFTHLFSHHGDKYVISKFDISSISKDDKKTIIFKCIKCNLHFVHEREVNEHFAECDESGIGGECKKCGLKYKYASLYKNKHKSVCEKKYEIRVISEVKETELLLKERVDDAIDSFVTNKDLVLAKEYRIGRDYLLNLDLTKYSSTIYKCDVCNVYYITENTWRRHKHFLTVYDACTICGLNFSLASLDKHKFIHHEKFNLALQDYVIVK